MHSVTITCPACGHEDSHATTETAEEYVSGSVLVCSECRTRTSYGKTMPRIVVEPYVDEQGFQWLRRRFQDPTTKEDLYVVDVDPQYAATEAKNILSVVLP